MIKNETAPKHCFCIERKAAAQNAPRPFIFLHKYSGLSALAAAVAQAQQAGDGAQRRQTHQREDDAADGAGGTAEQPAHKVKAEQADEAPVHAAHNEQSNTDFVKHPHEVVSSLPGSSLPG